MEDCLDGELTCFVRDEKKKKEKGERTIIIFYFFYNLNNTKISDGI
jgi:hypothetical protein